MKALILADNGFDDLLLFGPLYRLQEEGVEVTLATPNGKAITGLHGYRCLAEPDALQPIHDVNPGDYDLLLIPGGTSPESLRLVEQAVDITRTFMEEDRHVAALGRGPQLLISAGALSGRRATCPPAIRDDLRAAGATYRDDGVVVDGNLITCRGHADLAEFGRHLTSALGAHT